MTHKVIPIRRSIRTQIWGEDTRLPGKTRFAACQRFELQEKKLDTSDNKFDHELSTYIKFNPTCVDSLSPKNCLNNVSKYALFREKAHSQVKSQLQIFNSHKLPAAKFQGYCEKYSELIDSLENITSFPYPQENLQFSPNGGRL